MKMMPSELQEKQLIAPIHPLDLETHSNLETAFLLTQATFSVHLVKKGDIYYQKGRDLAQDVYRQVWKTERLVDSNDYGIVIEYGDQILGNMNIQLRQEDNLLKSEVFFKPEHWKGYFDASPMETVEISGIAIAQDTPSEIRQLVMMLLLHGGWTITRSLGIRFWSTIQHRMLYLMLTRRLGLSFLPNEGVTCPSAQIPSDDYWQGAEPPRIYYLDLENFQTLQTFNLFFCYLMVENNIQFLPRFQSHSLAFKGFCKMVKENKCSEKIAV